MATVTIIPIVEGQGEVQAVPALLHRLGEPFRSRFRLEVRSAIRCSRDKIAKDGELERLVELATVRLEGGGAILLRLDADDDCPADLGPHLLARAQRTRPDRLIRVVLACREYESWFLAAANSLAGVGGLPADLKAHDTPEAPRDAKGWLSAQMRSSRSDSPVADQTQFTKAFDIQAAAQRSPSFRRFCRVCNELFQSLLPSDDQEDPAQR